MSCRRTDFQSVYGNGLKIRPTQGNGLKIRPTQGNGLKIRPTLIFLDGPYAKYSTALTNTWRPSPVSDASPRVQRG